MFIGGAAKAQVTVNGNVYGGGNVAVVGGNSQVNIDQLPSSTVEGKVFGGGNEAGVEGTATVNMNKGVVKDGVYGGCNTDGTITGAVAVNILGGTVGVNDSEKKDGIYGGGYGHTTATSSNVTVTIGELTTADADCPVINGDVYGGSALGNVNGNNNSNSTRVDILNAKLHGSVYGGGLGEATLNANGYVDRTQPTTEALVYGPVLVNIGSDAQTDGDCHIVIDGSVFGCNNLAGSPQRGVDVHVYRTGHDEKNIYTYHGTDSTFALAAVYGGGDQADYAPDNGNANSAFKANVHIHNCFNTIHYVYGGGNAAASVGVTVDIEGGKFGWVFGGGNGAGTYNPGANIGAGGVSINVHGGYIAHLFGGSNERGTISGRTVVSVDAVGSCSEYVSEFFGGSNLVDMVGDVETNVGCGTVFGAVYGGSNAASITGNVTLNIKGGTMDYVYGGSKGVAPGGTVGGTTFSSGKAADILDNPATTEVEGNVTLNLYGGIINQDAFGGSNVSGNVEGKITVNVFDMELGCDPLDINNLYGAGNETPYQPLTSVTSSPVVNVMHIKQSVGIRGNVYGGGKGATAIAYANPQVTIGYDEATMSTYAPSSFQHSESNIAALRAVVAGSVYGGGNAAAIANQSTDILGSPTVTVQKSNTVIGGSLYGGGNAIATGGVTGPAYVYLKSGLVSSGIYGGCNAQGTMADDVFVTVTGGSVGVDDSHPANIHGGGFGQNTSSSQNVTVTIGTVGGQAGDLVVHGCVYGGSALGTVCGNTSNTVSVTVNSGTVTNRVFGGGLGDLVALGEGHSDIAAVVNGNIAVNINGGVVSTAVYGGNDSNGDAAGTVSVNITGGIIGNVVGGGNMAAYSAPVGTPNYPAITISGGRVRHKIICGGNNADVTGNPIISITGGNHCYEEEDRGVFGGCNNIGTVNGNTTVTVTGGNIGTSAMRAQIFGGGYGYATSVTGNVQVTVGDMAAAQGTNPRLFADVYGGSAQGTVNTNASNTTTVNILNGEITGDVYGGGLGNASHAAPVNGKVYVNIGQGHSTGVDTYAIDGGKASFPTYTVGSNKLGGRIFGCNNTNGSPKDDVFVHIWQTARKANEEVSYSGTGIGHALYQVFGGGNNADYKPTGVNTVGVESSDKKTHVYVHGCDNTIFQVFGACNAADAHGVYTVIDGGRFEEIFGGGNGAASTANVGKGKIYLEVKGGDIGYVFEYCNFSGGVIGVVSDPVTYKSGGGTCGDVNIRNHFCGGNNANVIGDVVTTIECNKNYTYTNIYGGCRLGTIYGDVRLTIEGGTFDFVYGGSHGDASRSADIKKFPTMAALEADHDKPADQRIYSDELYNDLHNYLTLHPTAEGTGGNIYLTITGGDIGSAFGGCDVKGNVEGNIIVIVEDDNDAQCNVDLDYVYGGGRLAEYNPVNCTSLSNPTPLIELRRGIVNHDVFGGGFGSETDVNAGLVASNPKIIMQDNFWVKGIIYGGGELASVGTYTRNSTTKAVESCADNTGICTIDISGGRIGPDGLAMPNDIGHVFGGGKGITGYVEDFEEIVGNPLIPHLNYVSYTDVTIRGGLVEGSVYGGGMNGHVLNNTHVKIQGGQIGVAAGMNTAYSDGQFFNPTTTTVTDGNKLTECPHWDFTSPYSSHDPFADNTGHYTNGNSSENGRPVATDGHTWYGNVFGGGSGYYPYAPGKWLMSAGAVYGSTLVEISGGHILTSVYGGNELTNVEGDSCVIIMSGGTLGVPRTQSQIAAHPVTCYLFGGGKGDPRIFFNKNTNVNNVRVDVKGGIIYGSVFGGGEDGHVLGSVNLYIREVDPTNNPTVIGTQGISYVDGNIFGGGRGFSGDALTAGNVAGDITVNISGGNMLGSIYGGGRLASVGYGLYAVNEAGYGIMRDDNTDDAGNAVANFPRGHITVNISGGIIGNDVADDYNLDHPRGGNVFGASMGRLEKLDHNYPLSLWQKLGAAKQTNVNISAGTIKGNVYGGSELGTVIGNTNVTISGGTIGVAGRVDGSGNQLHGNVYGGGYGSPELTSGQISNQAIRDSVPLYAGRVFGNSQIDITAGSVLGSVYGGGERASVGDKDNAALGNTTVNIGSSTISAVDYTGNATIAGNIYGANNIYGTPFGNTNVNIYRTARAANEEASYVTNTGSGEPAFALHDVFGGGNHAAYAPESGNTSSEKRANVHVWGCLNTVERVFGGGNAADAHGVVTDIDGGRFDYIFGGGNGEIDPASILQGGTDLNIHGGRIAHLFGGSNQQGTISGPVSTTVDNVGGCDEVIGEFFAGSNLADITGNLNTEIDCGAGNIVEAYGGCKQADITGNVVFTIKGGTYTTVYGGSKGTALDGADISGAVTLNINGGTIVDAFGGSNVNGNVGGKITVNVLDEEVTCGVDLTNVYGAGNEASYHPTSSALVSPEVNILHVARVGGIRGFVYGGGLGATAVVTANPKVTIGDDDPGHTAVVTGTVFGGGKAADVVGTTSVLMQNANSRAAFIYGGGALADILKDDANGIVAGTNVTITGGQVVGDATGPGDVYGGCVGGLTSLGDPSDIAANVQGPVSVTISGGTVTGSVYGCNNHNGAPISTVSIDVDGAASIANDVYGGGNLADAPLAATDIDIAGGVVNGNVFGGGHGQLSPAHAAGVGSADVTVSGGRVLLGVYGGCNVYGTVVGNSSVNLQGGIVGTSSASRANGVFGGGLGENTIVAGNVTVNLSGATVYSDLYGGSALGTVNTNNTNNTTVNFLSGNIYGDIYGGSMGDDDAIGAGHTDVAPAVHGKVYVNIGRKIKTSTDPETFDYVGDAYFHTYNDGTVKGGSVYGCNNLNGTPKDDVYVNIYNTAHPSGTSVGDVVDPYKTGSTFNESYAIDQVFGGGNKSDYNPTGTQSIYTAIYGCDNTIRRVFGGGNAAHATRISLDIQGGRFGDVFAGGNGEVTAANVTEYLSVGKHGGKYGSFTDASNSQGSVPSGTNYNKDESAGPCGAIVITDYFCGNNAGSHSGKITKTVTCSEGQSLHVRNLYGGCNMGNQDGDIEVVIEGGTYENVYGGCKGTATNPANVYGNIIITVTGGTIGNLFGGCDVNGNVTGTIEVNVEDANSVDCPLVVHNVYGGGNAAYYKPTTAAAHATVNIKKGTISKTSPSSTTTGNVFGGGKGSTAVFCQQEICNGGSPTSTVNSTPYGPEVNIGDATNPGYIAIVEGNVYGGGDEANTNGSSNVRIRNNNTIIYGDVFGGANHANLSRDVTVEIGASGASDKPEIRGSVYGGSALGNVSCSTQYTPSPQVNVTLYNGTVLQNIFGGGLGDLASLGEGHSTIAAEVNGPVAVKVYGGTVAGGVYGCNNYNGKPENSVTVDIYGSDNVANAIANVFGGGNRANYTYAAAPVVTVHNGTTAGTPVIGNVYGGGNAASVPATSVTVWGGTIDNVFGGGNGAVSAAPVTGNTDVDINGGTIGNIYGGNNTSGNIAGNITVDITNATETGGYTNCATNITGNVYGGGNLAEYRPTVKTITSPLVTFTDGTVEGNIFGGGRGSETSINAGLVLSNPKVIMNGAGAWVKKSIYGGGENGSVGDLQRADADYVSANPSVKLNTVLGCAANTGKSTVEISNGTVGPASMPVDWLTAYSGSDFVNDRFIGHVFGGGKGIVGDTIERASNCGNLLIPYLNYVYNTQVTISGGFIKGSVYGGAQNGHVKGDTRVDISGGQIGCGAGESAPYTPSQWAAAVACSTTAQVAAAALSECPSWSYGAAANAVDKFMPFDMLANASGKYDVSGTTQSAAGGRPRGDDGHTFYGNVFGGGSGYFNVKGRNAADNADEVYWIRTAGRVEGNTVVNVTGGHILTSIYGGNELTDVLGNCTVNFGGTATLGVPRTINQIDAHPVTCYLFGAGKGDARSLFNTWTMVGNTTVNVDGGRIFGSVFGGGEDGHVGGNAIVNIKPGANIGTQGLSYVDGNVFGGGRGYSGTVLTTGTVCGNVTLNITGGIIRGSVYGGGRLASVGTFLDAVDGANYGKMQDGDNHGVIRVNISQVDDSHPTIIGNNEPYVYLDGSDFTSATGSTGYLRKMEYDPTHHILLHTISGNVFGGCMGRIKNIDGTVVNPIWANAAKAKRTIVTVTGGTIMSSVYGGGEMGTVTENATVNITGGTIGTDIAPGSAAGKAALKAALKAYYIIDDEDADDAHKFSADHYHFGSAFGGGYGSEDYGDPGVDLVLDYTPELTGASQRTPAVEIAGRVYGSSNLTMSGGQVLENVFGGGDLASVGTPDYSKNLDASDYYKNLPGSSTQSGHTVVSISGTAIVGPLDMTGMNGYVYGAGKGVGNDLDGNYDNYCNVGSSEVTVNLTFSSPDVVTLTNDMGWNSATDGRIWGSVFGGGADCHVLGNASVRLTGGLIGKEGVTSWDGNIFGGGRNYLNVTHKPGRVAGNVTVTMTGGYLMGSIFGGGRLALTGVDHDGDISAFIDGSGDYLNTTHGLVTVNVSGGSIGNPDPVKLLKGSDESVGDIFGSGKGDTKNYVDIVGGRVMNTSVTVSGSPRIYGSVFGGGEMASIGWWYAAADASHALNEFYGNTGSSIVDVSGGTIGTTLEYEVSYMNGTGDDAPSKWTVFDTLANGTKVRVNYTCTGNIIGGCQGDVDTNSIHWISMGRSRTSTVNISGTAVVLSNVFGGAEQGVVTENTYVNINGGTIGQTNLLQNDGTTPYCYGSVYGGGYGSSSYKIKNDNGIDNDSTNTPIHIAGRVYGNTYVTMTGGSVARNVYGGGNMASVGYVDALGNMHNGNCQVKIVAGSIGPSTPFASPVETNQICGHVFGGCHGLVGQDWSKDAQGKNNNFSTECNVNTTEVLIGQDSRVPNIRGSVFGGGENGHVLDTTLVIVTNGLIGNGTKYTGESEYINNYCGNVYGGGSGIDVDLTGKLSHTAGRVVGATHVKIINGHICNNVYGGGSMATVGEGISDDDDIFKLYKNIDYLTNKTGRAWVEVSGGLIGIYAAPTGSDETGWTSNPAALYGSVYGGGRGLAGHDLEKKNYYASFGYVNNTVVEIKYASVDAAADGNNHIVGNVFGGGNNGHVKNCTRVIVTGGRIGSDGDKGFGGLEGNIFGGGNGTEKYKAYRMDKIGGTWKYVDNSGNALDNQNDPSIRIKDDSLSVTSGLVYGDTKVTVGTTTTAVGDIHVMHHVYGGGNMGSVGDYGIAAADNNPTAAGGLIAGEIYALTSSNTPGFHDSNTEPTGKCEVTVLGGEFGTTGGNNGMIFGGCRGDIGAPGDLMDSVAYFYSGTVTIGHTAALATDKYTNPLIHGTVYGGGENGHCVNNTYVNVHSGRIGTNSALYDETKGYDEAIENDEIAVASPLQQISDKETQIRNLMKEIKTLHDQDASANAAAIAEKQAAIDALQTEINSIKTDHASTFTNIANNKALYNANINILSVRGNVYGGGCGTDKYDSDNDGIADSYNPRAGVVYGNATVTIDGGYVERNVYGSGAMANLGTPTSITFFNDETKQFALSWPIDIQYRAGTGTSTVAVSGTARIGYSGSDNGDIFGAARGEAGDRGVFNKYANVNNTVVTINLDAMPIWDGDAQYDPEKGKKYVKKVQDGVPVYSLIAGSVYGGSENGHVTTNATTTMTNGVVGHGIYGGGKGKGTFKVTLDVPYSLTGETYEEDAYAVTAGKVYGNTYVTMTGGHVIRNLYGGGNMGSVGKGNYGGGEGDYLINGLGEKIIYATRAEATAAGCTDCHTWEDTLNSGQCHVTVTGGILGSVNGMKDDLPTGNVFGAGRGEPAPNVDASLSPRWHYYPSFYSSYVNKSIVVIGNSDGTGPTVYGSVFGGGQDGHVRFTTDVTVYGGEIGLVYNETNQEALAAVKYDDPPAGTKLTDQNDLLWYARGNVFGGGSGLGKLPDGSYSTSAGSVTCHSTVTILGGTIHRNVYGGGNLGSVGQPKVPPSLPEPTIAQSKTTVNIGKSGNAVNSAIIGDPTSVAAEYGGCVYGSSRGGANLNFDFAKTVWTEVNIEDGAHVLHSVYGGGEMGYVRRDANVYVKSGTVDQFVFGGGKGLDNDPGIANVRGRSTVTMTGGNVINTIFGGGQMASVGTFEYADRAFHEANPSFEEGEPMACEAGTGITRVLVSGGVVGMTSGQTMENDVGYIFGAGMGVYTQPNDEHTTPPMNGFNAHIGYVDSSEVVISETALIMGAVWGGSENGQVLHNSGVHVDGGQIGCGVGKTTAYDESLWSLAKDAVQNFITSDIASLAAQMPECSGWPYGVRGDYFPYDEYAVDDGLTDAATTGDDGHTYFGNVFGGGSGYYPYRVYNSVTHRTESMYYDFQGRTRGNTWVVITAGHILTSVYGGSEIASVGGDCNVIMSGGTIGVPRTLAQIQAHPVTCYLFGAGKGDQRSAFNKKTNVNNVHVKVTGGHIFGSVFGGGEDGHILGNSLVEIGGDALIGTFGTSYVDGNVFGGGRGFSGESATAGNVGGTVTVNITGGTMLGSIYGGGRLASVGYGLYDETDVDNYGVMRDDNVDDEGNAVTDFPRGYITVNISGGIIGNDVADDYNLDHPRGGNVFGASMGRLEKLDHNYPLSLWQKLGAAKQTNVNISAGTIKGNVYGGSELGTVIGNTNVTISGGTIGVAGRVDGSGNQLHGNVYGGGYGSNIGSDKVADETTRNNIHTRAGRTYGDTRVDILAGTIHGSVFGGGEMASIGGVDGTRSVDLEGNTTVNIGNDMGGSATVYGDVFGCNNYSGTPMGNVDVHIYHTAHTPGDGITSGTGFPSTLRNQHDDGATGTAEDILDSLDLMAISAAPQSVAGGWGKLSNPDLYALRGVYGGGNQASYIPASGKKSTVTVHYCDENTVYQVYGGGKGGPTAVVEHTAGDVIIEGGHIYRVFAGGNGDYVEVPGNMGANVGTASITIKGGIIQDIFGGSNNRGTVGNSTVTFDVPDPTNPSAPAGCDILNDQVFGGGNRATGEGDITVNIPCGLKGIADVYGCGNAADFTGNITVNVLGGVMNRLFGGARQADIKGNVTVNVFSGDINEVYGGNNAGGFIFGDDIDHGNIIVNVDINNDVCPSEKRLGYVFGGGNNAAYKPDVTSGVTFSEGEYTFSSGATFTNNADRVSPRVNIISGTIEGAVFGGGNGASAEVMSNPQVYVGAQRIWYYDPVSNEVRQPYLGSSSYNNPINIGTGPNTGGTDINGNVFGGGNAAQVTGSTTVKIAGEHTIIENNVYGGGNNAKVTGDTDVTVDTNMEN